ncbi:MAG: hypothetical protein MJ133_01875 [Lachnospiraceae bacterium]|nr:hypothetical protein [Lachnospiraceae bacterium]
MEIRNHRDLERAYQEHVLDRLFITPDAERIIKQSIEMNLNILLEAYKNEDGGYIKIITNSITTKEGREEYMAELAKYNLESSICEFNDLLVSSGSESVFVQLFAMTEYNLVLVYLVKGEI